MLAQGVPHRDGVWQLGVDRDPLALRHIPPSAAAIKGATHGKPTGRPPTLCLGDLPLDALGIHRMSRECL
jgi:hypothetical protein